LPVPALPELIVIHDALLVAVQKQVEPAVTLTLPLPPPEAQEYEAGVMA
jgi:hypothetical protein